jgi:enoyl-CoA hydratase
VGYNPTTPAVGVNDVAAREIMAYEFVSVERDDAVAVVTITRPAVLNALNQQTLDEIADVFQALDADDRVRALVLTGSGEKAFVAGADINELARQTPIGGRDLARRGQRLFTDIEQLDKPVIAAIHGFALGGGCELALACTFRLAADTARIGLPEITLGLIPGYGGTVRLARLIGKDRAMEMILTGRHVSADEAYHIGLVTRVVPAASLLAEARQFAHDLAAKAPIALRTAKRAIERGLEMPFDEALELEATLFGLVATTEDMREGTRAFLEKRKPAFRGQ